MNVDRINQLWPSDLKHEVLTLVGKRGLTSFTIQAVKEKIERDKGQPDVTPEPIEQESQVVVDLPAVNDPVTQYCKMCNSVLDNERYCWLCAVRY